MMPVFNINIFWVLLVAIPSLFATINAIIRWIKYAKASGSVDNMQNQEIALLKGDILRIDKDIIELKRKAEIVDGRITGEIKELEKKIDGRFDQVIHLITQISRI